MANARIRFWRRRRGRLLIWLLGLSTARLIGLFVVLAIAVSVVIVLTMDYLWDGRLNVEMEVAGIVTPLLDGLLIVGVLLVWLLAELRSEFVHRRKAERTLRSARDALGESESNLAALFENVRSCVVVYRAVNRGKDFVILTANRAAEQQERIVREAMIGKRVTEVFPGIREMGLLETFRRVWRSGNAESFPLAFYQDDRISGWRENYVYKLPNGNIVAIYDDVTERKQSESRIEFLASHDALTGLLNRMLMKDRFAQSVAYSERNDARVAVLFLDVDHFKVVNDSLGHAVGDSLLKQIAERLQLCIRETDSLGRHGGDEFLIVLSDIRDSHSVAQVVDKIRQALAEPFDIEGNTLSVSASIGAAVYPNDGADFNTLLKNADAAMYDAKEAGRNTCHFFSPEMNAEAGQRLRIRNGLQRGLAQNEFVVFYQPQIDLTSGAVVGAEALLRWNSPEFGFVEPARFIPDAEESGLIVPIGAWVLKEACRQAVEWKKCGFPEFVVAVNLSAIQFIRGDIEQAVISALTETGLPPETLELELTESILIKDTENALQKIQRLKALGVRLSIDDFGTGYSSLAYLKRFAVDKVKIDQSFTRDMLEDPNSAVIVHTIIQMARSMGLRTIAEGVETAQQADYLRLHGCDEAQGYFISKPKPAGDFPDCFENIGLGKVAGGGSA